MWPERPGKLQSQIDVWGGGNRVRSAARLTNERHCADTEVGAVCGNSARTDLCGGRNPKGSSLPRPTRSRPSLLARSEEAATVAHCKRVRTNHAGLMITRH